MKKLMILLVAVVGFSAAASAQINVSINIGSQPAWGPTGYNHVDYYYMPDIDCYYDVPNKVYVYQEGNSWRRAKSLPSRYRNYDIYNGHKVVINGVDKPYLQNNRYRKEYAGFKGKHDQTPNRDNKQWANNRNHKNDNNRRHGRR